MNNSPESGFTLSLYAGEDDEEIGCCSSLTGRALEGSLRHPECLPIDISASDTFYGRFGQRCMEFARSLTAFGSGCRLGAREQVGTRHGGDYALASTHTVEKLIFYHQFSPGMAIRARQSSHVYCDVKNWSCFPILLESRVLCCFCIIQPDQPMTMT